MFRRTDPGNGQGATPPDNVLLVNTKEGLAAVAKELSQETILAFDTEFIRERSYTPKLELVQLATASGRIVLLDYGSIGLRRDDPLAAILRDSKVLKVFHAAEQDLEMLEMVAGEVPGPIWDTQLVTGFIGYGGRTGYGAIVEALLGERTSTSETLTDWSRRPLTSSQLRYAAEDVRHLLPLYEVERKRLGELGREAWAIEECANLRTRVEETLARRRDASLVHQRIKGWTKLDREHLAILRELATWREETAKSQDRLRSSILRDEMLVDIARRAPEDAAALRSLRMLQPRDAKRYGADLLECVSRAGGLPDSKLPEKPRGDRRLSDAERVLVSLLQAVVKAIALREELAPGLVATAGDLETLVQDRSSTRGPDRTRLLRGWRRRLLGDDLLAVLRGKRGVVWDPKGRELRIEAADD